MSYISILLPAFHLNTTDISEISKQCSIQFGLSPDKFDVLEIFDKSPIILLTSSLLVVCLIKLL